MADHFIHLINKAYPLLKISSIEKIGQGDNSVAFLVNGIYIFKFPKNNFAERDFQKERIFCAFIAPQLKVPVPDFIYHSPVNNFIGYKMLEGNSLSQFKSKREGEIKNITYQCIAHFLTDLHAIIPGNEMRGLLPIMDYAGEYTDNLSGAKEFIFHELIDKERNFIQLQFTRFLKSETTKYSPSLIHNDFSPNHILVNAHSGLVSGILDFGDAAIGNPDYDYLYLFDFLGIKLFTTLFKKQVCSIENVLFFSLANKIQILLDEIKHHNTGEINKGFINLKKCIAKIKIE